MPTIAELMFGDTLTATFRYDAAKRAFVPVAPAEPKPAGAVTVEYRPRYYSTEYEVRNAQAEGLASQAVERIKGLIASWDLQAEDGSVIELSDAGLAPVPTSLLNLLFSAVLEEMNPDPSSSGN